MLLNRALVYLRIRIRDAQWDLDPMRFMSRDLGLIPSGQNSTTVGTGSEILFVVSFFPKIPTIFKLHKKNSNFKFKKRSIGSKDKNTLSV